MKARPMDSASARLQIAKARGKSPGWLASQTSDSQEQGPSLSRGVPPRSGSLRGLASSPISDEEVAVALRSRLLKMIVANEQSRAQEQSCNSQSATSGPHE